MSALPDSEILQEQRLWMEFRQGLMPAFETLYRRYFRVLSNYGYRLTSDRAMLEDAIHDVFVDLWRRREFLSDVENIRFYLFRALRNRVVRISRTNLFENAEDIDYFLDYLVSISAEDLSIDAEQTQNRAQRIHKAVADLSDRQKEVINLRFYHGLSLDEISVLMGITKQGVSNLLFKSYAVLRVKLKELTFLTLFSGIWPDLVLQ